MLKMLGVLKAMLFSIQICKSCLPEKTKYIKIDEILFFYRLHPKTFSPSDFQLAVNDISIVEFKRAFFVCFFLYLLSIFLTFPFYDKS